MGLMTHIHRSSHTFPSLHTKKKRKENHLKEIFQGKKKKIYQNFIFLMDFWQKNDHRKTARNFFRRIFLRKFIFQESFWWNFFLKTSDIFSEKIFLLSFFMGIFSRDLWENIFEEFFEKIFWRIFMRTFSRDLLRENFQGIFWKNITKGFSKKFVEFFKSLFFIFEKIVHC